MEVEEQVSRSEQNMVTQAESILDALRQTGDNYLYVNSSTGQCYRARVVEQIPLGFMSTRFFVGRGTNVKNLPGVSEAQVFLLDLQKRGKKILQIFSRPGIKTR